MKAMRRPTAPTRRRVGLAARVALLAALAGCRERPPAAPAPNASAAVAPAPGRAPDAGPPDPKAAEARAIQDKVAAVLLCFHRDMLARQKDPSQSTFAGYRRNTFTDLFVFHYLFDDGQRLQQETETLCRGLGERYRAAFSPAAPARGGHADAAEIWSGTPLPVDNAPEFARAVGNLTGLHILEHAEITREALLAAGAGRHSPIVAMAARSSQQPDILRWDDLRFHALSAAAPGEAGGGDRANSEEAFVGLMSYQLVNFVLALRDGADARAALLLGIACHLAQDLAWNRGLTRDELATLQLVVRRDPRRATSAAARREALRASKRVLQIARDSLADGPRWTRFLASRPPALDFDNAIDRVLVQDAQATPLSLGHLTDLWISQLPGRRSADTVRDLTRAPQGKDPWQLEPLFERIARSVRNSGLALDRDTGR
jgi:hypothetical protein